MTAGATASRIVDLVHTVDGLPKEGRARFERIYHLDVTTGEVVPPEAMHAWLTGIFGSVNAVRRQRIVKITNKVTLEGALFNELRASRPIEAPVGDDDLEQTVHGSEGGPFCKPESGTPADLFGRVSGEFSITASNVAKYDGWHAVVVFDEHHPLHFSAARVADYVKTAQAWAREAHKADPGACYPFFLWNCLWRSGASILHGHAQMALTHGMHYAMVEGWRQAAHRYRTAHGSDYFADLVAANYDLGLAVEHGSATILPSLTPFKEKESLIIGQKIDDDLTSALYRVLTTYITQLGVQSFNVGLYQPPLGEVEEDWDDFPFIFRVIERGDLHAKTSDIGAMEMFAQSVVATDPFRVADALRAVAFSPIPGENERV